jgi:hypothetical protein
MKRLVKSLWRLSAPLRRPFQWRLERFLTRCLAQALKTHDPSRTVTDEVTLVLDAVVAEQFRLQEQIDDLQRALTEGSYFSCQHSISASFSGVTAHSEGDRSRPMLLSAENPDR